MSIARETVADANTEAVGSMNSQLEVYNQSIQASLDKFHVAFQELSADLINSDFLKGIVDVGTDIIHIIDESVKHIGVLGTALTGLGIAKIFTTAVNGAKSVEVASDGVELLATALETAQGSGAGLTGTIKGLSGVLGTLGAKAGGAGSALGAMFSSLGGFLASPAGLVTAGIAAVAGITAYAINARKKQQEELRKQATATTEKWGDDKSSVDDYKRQYTELNDQLKNVNLTESERIGIKQQLLDLQNQISAKYGADAGQLDLINGKYETQLGLISQITEKEAHRNLQNNREAYQQSIDEMTKDRTYTMVSNGSGSDLMKKIEWAYAQSGFKDQGDLTFEFTGDVSEADESIRSLMDRLGELKETASDTEKEFIDSVISATGKLLTKNQQILDANQANYQAYLEQSLYDDGYGDELAEYSKLVKEYNEALMGDDVADAYKKRSEMLAYYRDNIDGVFEGTQYEDFFTGITNQIDTASEKMMDWQDIIDDETTYATNSFSKSADIIRKTISEIKKLKLDGVDIQAILGDPNNAMYKDISQLARLWDPNIDLSNKDSLQTFADFLMQAAYGADAFGGSVDLAKSEFDDFMKSASASIDTLDKVNAALVNSFKSGGLSARIDAETGALTGDVATILNAYKKELGDGSIDDLFERTADGIIVNRDALRALQAQQENTTKAEFIERIKEAEAHLASASTEEERQAWQTRLDNVKLLASAYDGATSAYQKWLDAQKMGEAGDQYDTIASTALKRGKELYDKGLVGTNEFRAIAQLYSDEDLALASIDEITEAYENGVDTVKKYFTEGQEGAVAFADKLVELGAATKEGDFYNFEDGINTSEIADELDISVDLVEAAFKKLGDYGFDIHFMNEDQIAEFDTLTEKAEEAQDKLKELRDSGAEVGDTELIDIDLSEIDTVDEMKSALDQLNEVVASPDIDPESAEAYQAIIDSLQQKLDLLSQTDIGNEVNFSNLDNAYTLLGSLQGRIDSINGINATSSIDIDVMGDDEVQLVAEQIANLPPDIKTAIGFDVEDDATAVIEKLQNETVQIPVEYQQPTNTPTTGGTTTVDVQYSQGDIPSIEPQTVHIDYEPNPIEANVVANLDSTEVDTYNPANFDDRYVRYSRESSEVDSYNPPNFSRTVNYSVNVSGAGAVYSLPDDDDRYITYHIETIGSAPSNYRGTVPTSAFQGMAHVGGTAHASGLSKYGLKQDENSLINELGAEIVVRPSEDSWMIFNDGMPTFANLKRGDVIFDAEQSKELLEKGWTKNYASVLGGAFASGTVKGSAHARKVTGSGSFKKAKSSSSSGGGGNGGGNSDGGGWDGGDSEAKEEAEEFAETLDEIEILIDRIERDIKNLDTVASNVFNNWIDRNDALVNSLHKVSSEISYQQDGYLRYLKQANNVGLDSYWTNRVQEGNIDIEEVNDEDTWNKIQEYKKWYDLALDCRDAIYQLRADEADLWKQRFDLDQSWYESRIKGYETMYDVYDSYIERAENTGRITANKYRLAQIDEENKKISMLSEEYNYLKGTMLSALESGKITVESDGYYEMLNAIEDINKQLVEARTNVTELNKAIRETNWEIFDRVEERIDGLNDELEFLYGLLGDEEKFFDDSGRVNDNGIAAFGVLTSQYNIAMQESKKYANEIKKINKDLASDPYNQDLIDRQNELNESQRKAIENAEKYKESIVDLVKTGIKAQIESVKDLIDTYTDLLDAEKDESDYAKKVSNAQENINKITKQLNAYANDDTEEGATRRQKLRGSLKEAQESLADTEEERRLSQVKQVLSELQEEYENILNARFDNLDVLIQAVVDGVNSNSAIISQTITTASRDVGYVLSSYMNNVLTSSSTLVSYFTNGDFVNKVTNIADTVKKIEQYHTNATKSSNTKAAKNVQTQKKTQTTTKQAAKKASTTGTAKKNSSNKISGIDGHWSQTSNGQWNWINNDGSKATGWNKINGTWYSFDNKGRMRDNEWFQDTDSKWYHLASGGAMDTNKWLSSGGKWYYAGGDGAMMSGWKYDNGNWYYMKSNGEMATSWIKDKGKWYNFSESGAMLKGWQKIGGKWYYMDDSGAAVSGWKYLDWNGAKSWYYFDPSSFAMVTNSWIDKNEKITTNPKAGDFWVDAFGVMVSGGKHKTNKGWNTFASDGKWRGYKTGTRSVSSDGLYWTNEGVPETIIRKSDGAVLTRLNSGDTVLNGNATQNMWDFANNPSKFLRGLGVSNTYGSGNNINLEFNLNGLRSPSEFMDALRKDKRFEKLIQEMTLGRAMGHGVLAKNAI